MSANFNLNVLGGGLNNFILYLNSMIKTSELILKVGSQVHHVTLISGATI